jgi:hypothetical protein
MSNAIVPEIWKFICIMGGRMQFAPTITGHPNKIGFTGKIYPEHLVLKQDLLDFEDDREQLWFGGMNNECHCSKDRFVVRSPALCVAPKTLAV